MRRVINKKMEQVKIPEINLTSDSEDFVDDYWFTSTSASFDGSSVNSIPWAEDVVKQNQELWERVERMFYGEESLPTTDRKLRSEIVEWTSHFPYLRVAGTSVPVHYSNNVISSDPHFQEVLAAHPPLYFDEKAAVGSTARTFDGRINRISRDNDVDDDEHLANDIEKCLRITSGPLLSRRAHNSRTAYGVRSTIVHSEHRNFLAEQPKRSPRRTKPALKSALVTMRSNYDVGSQFARKLYGSIDVPYSARIIKIPSLKCETSEFNAITTTSTGTATKPNMIRIKTAILVPINRPLRNSITLPAINIEPKYFDRSNNNEISALVYPNTSTKSAPSPNKSLKKRSESE